MRRVINHRYAPSTVWTAVCHPDDSRKTLVGQDGALLYAFDDNGGREQVAFGRVVEFAMVTGHTPVRVEQRTEDARTPVVVTTVRYPRATLVLRAFAHGGPHGPRHDVVLWEITVADDVDELLTGLHIDIYDTGLGGPDQRGEAVHVYRGPVTAASEPPADSVVLVSVPDPVTPVPATGFRPAAGLRTALRVVPGGGTLGGAVVVPLDGSSVDGVDLAWAQDALAAERAFWADTFTGLLPLRAGDPQVQAMLESSVRNVLQAREEVDGQLVFQVGSAMYRGLWMVDGHFLLEVARYLHWDADADRGLRTMLSHAKPDGSIGLMAFITLLKETGCALAAVVRQWELTGDDDNLRATWPVLRAALDHIESLRDQARALPADDPAHGLMPPAFPDGGASGARPELTTALWTLHGMAAALRAARRVAPQDVEEIAARHDSLLADLRRVARRERRRLPDGTAYVPMVLSGSGSHNRRAGADGAGPHEELQPQTSTWALAQAIWPGEVFAPDDELVTDFLALLERTDGEQDVPAASGFLPYRSVWTYYASFAAHAWLYAGRPDKAADYLYGFANHASPTRVWREEQSFVQEGNGQLFGDMPHNWASAEFVRLVRDLLVFERGTGLDLLAGLPEQWLASTTSVDRTPTRFGPVSVVVTPAGAQPDTASDTASGAGTEGGASTERGAAGLIDVTLPGPGPAPARLDRCALHIPDGQWAVTVNAEPLPAPVKGPTVLELTPPAPPSTD